MWLTDLFGQSVDDDEEQMTPEQEQVIIWRAKLIALGFCFLFGLTAGTAIAIAMRLI